MSAQITEYHAGAYKEGAIKLSANESNFGVSPEVKTAISSHIDLIQRYPDPMQQKLRLTLSEYLGISSNQLVLGNGSDEILMFIAMHFLNADSSSLSAAETFSVYKISSQIVGAKYHAIPLLNGTFDLRAFAKKIDEIQPCVVFLCNPNNPTGTYIPYDELSRFIANIPQHIAVVLDEAYIDFVDDQEYCIPLAEKLALHPNIIILRTFSKLFGLGGLRLGYGIASQALAEKIAAVRMPFHINSLAQEAACAAIDSLDFYHIVRNTIVSERARVYEEISRIGFVPYPSKSNFLCIPLDLTQDASTNMHTSPPSSLADECFDFFAKNNITIRSLKSFDMPHAIRISIGKPEENDKVISLLSEWKKLHM